MTESLEDRILKKVGSRTEKSGKHKEISKRIKRKEWGGELIKMKGKEKIDRNKLKHEVVD